MPYEGGSTERVRVAYAFLDLADGGAQRLTLASCRHLDRERFVASIVCLRGGGSLVEAAVADGLTVESLGRLVQPFDWRAVTAAARCFRATGAHVVHVQLYSRSSPYARLAARLAGVPLVVAHEWCREKPPGLARRFADAVLAPGTRYVATSESLARELQQRGAPPASIAVVSSGIDTDRFAPRDRAESRTALGLPLGCPICLVPARLHPMKGHVDLIASLVTILQRLPDLLVLVAGDGPLRRVLPALVSAAGLERNVSFLGLRADMPALYGASDVVVLPSCVEGIPSVILEALCGERPVVATRVGGVPEVMVDGVGGWMVRPRDPADLARGVLSALGDPVGGRKRAAAGRGLVLDRFRAEQTARRLEQLYLDWLGGPPTSEEARAVARAGRV